MLKDFKPIKKRRYSNARMPRDDRGGRDFLEHMNSGVHEKLADWGLAHLDIAKDADALDLGCGGGANLRRLLDKCPDGTVTGLDHSPASVEFSTHENAEAISAGKCRVLQGDVSDLPFDDASFDIAIAVETVYFWPDVERAFAEAARVLRPGGVFAIINEVDGVRDKAEEWVELIEDTRIHTPEQIEAWLDEAGFSQIQCDVNPDTNWTVFTATCA